MTYDKLEDVQNCLSNDKTIIKNLQWKFNYQLNAANKFQYLFQSDNKFRNAPRRQRDDRRRKRRPQQTSDKPWGLPLPTHSLTHTLIATDKLVFNNQFTYVHGGFFLDYQDVPPQGDCGAEPLHRQHRLRRRTAGRDADLPVEHPVAEQPHDRLQQPLADGHATRRSRHSWEAKTDGTYFLTNMLGGDHSLKFGVGWRRNPILTFSHYSGGARATMQCVGNTLGNCGDGVAGRRPGRRPGFVARIRRCSTATSCGTTTGGPTTATSRISYSRGRWRMNGGLRYDWQQSKYLGGCVPANAASCRTSCRRSARTRRRLDADHRPERSSRSATGRRACR